MQAFLLLFDSFVFSLCADPLSIMPNVRIFAL